MVDKNKNEKFCNYICKKDRQKEKIEMIFGRYIEQYSHLLQ